MMKLATMMGSRCAVMPSLRMGAQRATVLPAAATAARRFADAARSDVIGIDLGTTNSCVAVMEVRSECHVA